MRAAVLILSLLGIAACGKASRTDVNAVTVNATVADDGKIDCRVGADTQFEHFCSIERSRTDQGLIITVRKPDGGFRKLLATRDGRGVVAADGAEQASVQVIGPDRIEVAIGGDTFRLPARVGPVPQPQNKQ